LPGPFLVIEQSKVLMTDILEQSELAEQEDGSLAIRRHRKILHVQDEFE
jgi:hypothetical protein